MSHLAQPDPRRPGQPGSPVIQPSPLQSSRDPLHPATPDPALFSCMRRIMGFCADQLQGYSPEILIDALMACANEHKRAIRRHYGSRRPKVGSEVTPHVELQSNK